MSKHYWQAQGFVQRILSQFEAAAEKEDTIGQRRAFYRLTNYYGRTLHITHTALAEKNEELVDTALHNLMTLHRALFHIHQAAPEIIPLPIPLNPADRHEFSRDMVMRVVMESTAALDLEAIVNRVDHLDILGKVSAKSLAEPLRELVESGHLEEEDGNYRHTTQPYVEMETDILLLHAIAGTDLHAALTGAGLGGLHNIEDRPEAFIATYQQFTGFDSAATARLFLETIHLLRQTTLREASSWHYRDLLHSPYPRPYQRAAYAAFHHGDYQNLVIEAPTGSGKTLIGMMCIQDWLQAMQSGQSILVLVPTSNYQQQWIGELCTNPIGLGVSPEVIFSGTPTELHKYQAHTGEHPAIILLTYTAMAHLGSASGKGGFDLESVEMFLQEANVHYVVLDEIHKVVEDMHSISTQVTRVLTEWVEDGSLRGLVGFSGTAEAYRKRFNNIGLDLVHSVPMDDLVAAGFVAPFTELGVPFAFSDRERQIRELLDQYKALLRDYFSILGPDKLRRFFAGIPLEERIHIGHDLLGMYRGRKDWREALVKRFGEWENGRSDTIALTELKLVTILQIANNWSDIDLFQKTQAEHARFKEIVIAIYGIKKQLHELVYLPKTIKRLDTKDLARVFDADAVRQAGQTTPISHRGEAVKDQLATSITGLYEGLSEWYLRVGEGRVEMVKSIIEAERSLRDVSGIIVFERGRHIAWKEDLPVPGYEGVAGLFAQMLGDERFTCFAVLSNEMYLSYNPEDPLPHRIADFIQNDIMGDEAAKAIFNLAVQGLDLPENVVRKLESFFMTTISHYIANLGHVGAARHGEFSRKVLNPLKRQVRKLKLDLDGERLLSRLNRKNVHLTRLVQTFFDYALLVNHFREAHVSQLEQVSGAVQKFYVVTMPGSGPRKQLMYDLTSRIVDNESLPVNLVIVSSWARTGWNVIAPNVLIDATATRDVTAWQQLRGRAIRARRTWNNDCYRLLTALTGDHHLEGEESAATSSATDASTGSETAVLDEALWSLLKPISNSHQRTQIRQEGITGLSMHQRENLAVKLLEHRNKVTHIYEMVKAYGSGSQVTYDRTEKLWHRRDAIAAKHNRETSVNPFTGQKSADDSHSPLVYVDDPRADLPADLQAKLTTDLAKSDDLIIKGWLHGDA